MKKDYTLTEYVPSLYEMPSPWQGFWIKFEGEKEDFEKIKPALIKKCYSHMVEVYTLGKASGITNVEIIHKQENREDALNNKIFIATVGIKWCQQYGQLLEKGKTVDKEIKKVKKHIDKDMNNLVKKDIKRDKACDKAEEMAKKKK